MPGDEDAPRRSHREGDDEPAVAAVLVPPPQLPDGQRREQDGGERMAPQAEQSDASVARPRANKHHPHRLEQDQEVEKGGVVLRVVEVVFELLPRVLDDAP